MESKPSPQTAIPKLIIHTAKTFEMFSSKLAADFAYNLFVTPIRHKLPERELVMENDAKQQMVYVKAIGKKIRVFEYGQGTKKALLIHGWSGRGTQLVSIANALRDLDYQIISFDAPAHGQSEGKKSNMTMFIDSVFELQNIYGDFDLAVGHSLGAMTLMNAIKRGFITKKGVIIGCADVVLDIFEGFVQALTLKQKIAYMMQDKFEKKYRTKITDYDVFVAAQQTDIPILIIHDKQDKDVPWYCAEHIYQHLPYGELLITDGLGHRKILGDQQVIQRIIDFV